MQQIFDDDLHSTNVFNTKRTIDNEVSSNNKKFCLGQETATPSTIFPKKTRIPETRLGYPRITVRSPNKKVVVRKFPGPAGLLPDRRDFTVDIKALEVNHVESKQDNVDVVTSSNTSYYINN